MTHVMHVLAPGPIGGLERVVQSLALAQHADMQASARSGARAGRVSVVTLSGAPVRQLNGFLDPLSAAGVHVQPIVTPTRAYLRQREELRALIERVAPDVVHTHGAHADVLGVHLGPSVGAATVTTLHGMTGGGLKNRGYEWLQARCCRARDAVVAVSRPLAQSLLHEGFAPERTHVVRNTWRAGATPVTRIEARRTLGLPMDGFLVGWVGRISHEKGLDVLLDALGLTPSLDLHVVVIGDGADRNALARHPTARWLADHARIHWLGLRAEAARVLTAFDVVVLSSRTEGTPMLLLEAMAAGAPIVTTVVGGIPDVIGAHEALLVPSEDPRALYAAIDLVQRDATGARGRAGAATVRLHREHDLGAWARRYASVYAAAQATAAQRRAPMPRPVAVSAHRGVRASPAGSAP